MSKCIVYSTFYERFINWSASPSKTGDMNVFVAPVTNVLSGCPPPHPSATVCVRGCLPKVVVRVTTRMCERITLLRLSLNHFRSSHNCESRTNTKEAHVQIVSQWVIMHQMSNTNDPHPNSHWSMYVSAHNSFPVNGESSKTKTKITHNKIETIEKPEYNIKRTPYLFRNQHHYRIPFSEKLCKHNHPTQTFDIHCSCRKLFCQTTDKTTKPSRPRSQNTPIHFDTAERRPCMRITKTDRPDRNTSVRQHDSHWTDKNAHVIQSPTPNEWEPPPQSSQTCVCTIRIYYYIYNNMHVYPTSLMVRCWYDGNGPWCSLLWPCWRNDVDDDNVNAEGISSAHASAAHNDHLDAAVLCEFAHTFTHAYFGDGFCAPGGARVVTDFDNSGWRWQPANKCGAVFRECGTQKPNLNGKKTHTWTAPHTTSSQHDRRTFTR